MIGNNCGGANGLPPNQPRERSASPPGCESFVHTTGRSFLRDCGWDWGIVVTFDDVLDCRATTSVL